MSAPPRTCRPTARSGSRSWTGWARQSWTDFGSRNIIVRDGVVHLWGLVGSPAEHEVLLALAQEVPGVKRVADETIPAY